jgi:hypothetical protein
MRYMFKAAVGAVRWRAAPEAERSGHQYFWFDRRAPRGTARIGLQAVNLNGTRGRIGAAAVVR